MGIDIYLGGYTGYNRRIAKEREAFDAAVRLRDALPCGSAAHTAAQAKVDDAYSAMFSGAKGYIRSSYNGGGLFRVLEEIYGFDIGEYLFPGTWDEDLTIDGREFIVKVQHLQRVAEAALSRKRLRLPWIDIYSELTGQPAPDANASRTGGELLGDSVFKMIDSLGYVDVEGGPREPKGELDSRHVWYLTEGLKELADFGELAARYKGGKAKVHISY